MDISNGAVQSLTVAGRTFLDLANLIVLKSACSAATGMSGMRQVTTAYQVPAGKTLKIYASRVVSRVGSINKMILGYNDNSVSLYSTTASGANIVYEGGSTDIQNWTKSTAGESAEFQHSFSVPANKYPNIFTIDATSDCVVTVFGYLE